MFLKYNYLHLRLVSLMNVLDFFSRKASSYALRSVHKHNMWFMSCDDLY